MSDAKQIKQGRGPGRRIGAALMIAALFSCASLPEDPAADVRKLLEGRVPVAVPESDGLIPELLARPLGPREVIRIALMRNAGLRAVYAELGIAAADVYDAGRLSNPKLHVGLLAGGGAGETSLGITQMFSDVLLLSTRRRLAEREFKHAQVVVAYRTMRLAAQAEEAYYAHVGALHVARLRKESAAAAALSAELARRFFEAGNIGELQLKREEANASEARLRRLEAERRVAATASTLERIMGLGPDEKWRLARELPDFVAQEPELNALLDLAEKNRLDLRAAEQEVQLLSEEGQLARGTRLLGDLELGLEARTEYGDKTLVGPTLSWELPLFNQGAGRVARKAAALEAARLRLVRLRTTIQSSVALQHARMLNYRAIAREYQDVLIPARRAIVERLQEHVNFMLRGQFELLVAKQDEFAAMEGFISAVGDYWKARAALAREVGLPLSHNKNEDHKGGHK